MFLAQTVGHCCFQVPGLVQLVLALALALVLVRVLALALAWPASWPFLTALVQPALTTVSVAAKEIGRKAGELLYSRIQGNDEPPKRIILPPALVVRESCGFS